MIASTSRATIGALAACVAALALNAIPALAAPPAVGTRAPDFTLLTPEGTAVRLSSLRGKVVVVNFFATWCPPCNEEAPAIDALQRRYGAAGLQIVGVDVLESAAKAQEFRTQHHLSYPAVVDDGTLRNQYNVNGLPVHVFIDRSGTVRKIIVGELAPAEMRENIESILH